jgi:hypothetical protein
MRYFYICDSLFKSDYRGDENNLENKTQDDSFFVISRKEICHVPEVFLWGEALYLRVGKKFKRLNQSISND